jgi:hypothetical protein
MSEPDSDYGEISPLLDILTASHRTTLAALEKADCELAKTRAYFAAKAERPSLCPPENEKAG